MEPALPPPPDRDSIAGVLVRARDAMVAYVRRRTRGRSLCAYDPSDVVQSALGRVAREPGRYPLSNPRRLHALLRTVIDRLLSDLATRAGANKRMPAGGRGVVAISGDSTMPTARSNAGPLRVAQNSEETRRLHAALATLAESERAILERHYFEGLGPTELGAALGITADAARMRLRRALEELAQRLGAEP